MSKTTTLIVAVIVIFAGLIGFRYLKDSYKILPISQKQPTNIAEFNFQTWHEFAAPSGKFKVLFPSLPQHATENVDDPQSNEKKKYEMYVSQKDDGTIFMITLVSFKEPIDHGGDLLKEMMNDMIASNPNNKLLGMEEGEYKGNPALDFSLSSGELTIDAKSFITDNTLYVLSRILKPTNYTRDEFLFFVNSFELNAEGKSNTTVRPNSEQQVKPNQGM